MLKLWQKKIIWNQVPKSSKAKKLVSVLAISIPVTSTRKEGLGNAKMSKKGENSKNKDLGINFAQISCI